MKETVTISKLQLMSLLDNNSKTESRKIIEQKLDAIELKNQEKRNDSAVLNYVDKHYPRPLFSVDIVEIASDLDTFCAYINNIVGCHRHINGLGNVIEHTAGIRNNVFFFSTNHCQEYKDNEEYTPVSYGRTHKDFIIHDEAKHGNFEIPNPDPNYQA